MSWMFLVLLIVPMAVFGVLWRHRGTSAKKNHAEKKATEKKHHPATPTHGKYHCVTVHGNSKVCAGIQELQGKSLLPHETPTLPLAKCDMQPCKCHYIHHEDRRLGPRRNPYGELNNLNIATVDRQTRSRTDRRKAVPTTK